MIEKPKSINDSAYLSYVRRRCIVHPNRTNVDASHLIARGMGGKGQKGSDYVAVGMCRECHSFFHSLGLSEFERKFQVNVWKEAFELFSRWVMSGNKVVKYGQEEIEKLF